MKRHPLAQEQQLRLKYLWKSLITCLARGTYSPANNYLFKTSLIRVTCIALMMFGSIAASAQSPFITTWQTTTVDESITIPTVNSTKYDYEYTVDWGDGSTDATAYTGDATHTYSTAGTYTVSISGQFDQIFFNDAGDKGKIMSIEQWGSQKWKHLANAFRGCANLTYNATDLPDLSVAGSLSRAFMNATSFTGNLINWNVSNITDLSSMFEGATSFTSNLTTWNISNVTTTAYMFKGASSFNGNISAWDMSAVTTMAYMFSGATSFNQDISAWDVSSVTTMSQIFENASLFNSDISTWDVSAVKGLGLRRAFKNASDFNQDLSGWDVSGAEDFYELFSGASSFNGDVSTWNVSIVYDMYQIFNGASAFNGDISQWDVSSVGDFYRAFANASSFNQDISNWNTASAYRIGTMFSGAVMFNQDISSWDVSGVTDLSYMFYASAFNHDLSDWDVSGVTNFTYTFGLVSEFDQDLSSWDISSATSANGMLQSTGLSTYNYDKTLEGWSTLETGETTIPTGINLGTLSAGYCNSTTERSDLINTYGWTINDAGETCADFITTWETSSSAESITIPTNGTGYSYMVDWGDGSTDATTYTADASHTYTNSGTYSVTISGDFPAIYFNNTGSKDKIKSVDEWGTGLWTSMENAFYGSSNLTITATDIANVSSVTDMSFAFANAPNVNFPLGNWDVSSVGSMASMFANVTSLDQNLSKWDISNVSDMSNMLDVTGISETNYDLTLAGWSTLASGEAQIPTEIILGVNGLNYCEGATSRELLTNNYSWSIGGDEISFECILIPIGDQAVDEGVSLSFTVNTYDRQEATEPLTYGLDQISLDSGMVIDENSGVIDFTPSETQNGEFSSTISVTDGVSTTSETIQITVNEVNQDPILSSIGAQLGDENELLSFTVSVSDADMPIQALTLTLDQASIDLGMSLDESTHIFSWTPDESQNGTYSVTVAVNDGASMISETFDITIEEVNTAPSLGAIGNQNVDENANLTFMALGSDVDLPANTLTYSINQGVLDQGMVIDDNTGVFSWTPSESQQGDHTVMVSVSDGLTNTSETIVITVNEVESAPLIEAISTQTGDEETNISFTATATDVDLPAQDLTFSLDQTSTDLGMTIGESTGVFAWTPTESQSGDYSVTISVSDGVLSTNLAVNVAVLEVNELPVLIPIGSKSGDESVEISFSASATDSDLPAQTLTFTLDQTSTDAGMSIGSRTGDFSWTPTESQDGSYDVTVTVSDGFDTDEEVIIIIVSEVNQAPILSALGSKSSDEGDELNFTVQATDLDVPVQTILYSVDQESQDLGMTIGESTGGFRWTPTESQDGNYSVIITASDGILADSETITITINDINEAPVLEPMDNLSGDENTVFVFNAVASDIDEPIQSLVFSLDQVSLDLGMIIDINSGEFNWIPGEEQNGSFDVTVSVSDGSLTSSQAISIEVNEVNEAPVMEPIESKTGEEGTDISFDVISVDADLPAQTLSYSLDQESIDLGMTIGVNTGTFFYAASDFQFGTFQVSITVSDGSLTDSEVFILEILDVNQAPVLSIIGDQSVNEGESITFTAVATDEDQPAQSLSYSLEQAALDLGMTIDVNTGEFSWATDESLDGNYSVVVSVSDGELSDSETINLTVVEVNQAPVLAAIDDQSVKGGETVSFSVVASDEDLPAQSLSFSLDQASLGLGMSIDASTGVFSWTPATDQSGDLLVTITVSDGIVEVASQFTITVIEETIALGLGASYTISVFPNPAQDILKLNTSTTKGATPYFIVDQTGKLMASGNLKTELEIIDIKIFSSGTYVIITGEKDQRKFTRFIKRNE